MRAVGRKDRRRDGGQALVEIALVLPLLILIFMGVFDLGRGIFAFNEVSNAAREGGRTGIVNQNLADIRTRAAAQATGFAVPTTAPASCPANGGPPGSADPAGICVAILQPDMATDCSSQTEKIGCVVVVSVKYTFTPIVTSLPLIGAFIRPLALSSTTTQVIEATCSGGGCTTP